MPGLPCPARQALPVEAQGSGASDAHAADRGVGTMDCSTAEVIVTPCIEWTGARNAKGVIGLTWKIAYAKTINKEQQQ